MRSQYNRTYDLIVSSSQTTESKPTKYPFRLGTTSYIYPDHILPNVRKLQTRVDDIELLLFEADKESNLPTEDALAELKEISCNSKLSYTVHLPLDIYLGDFDETLRRESVEKTKRVIRLTECLRPVSYNLHFEKRSANGVEIRDIEQWKTRLVKSCAELAAEFGDLSAVSIETLNYPLEWVDDILLEFDLSIILDVGHLILWVSDPSEPLTPLSANLP